MKTITTIIITLLLLLTSCHKKDCEVAQGRLSENITVYQNREIIYFNNPTEENLNQLELAQQQVEQYTIAMERQCK